MNCPKVPWHGVLRLHFSGRSLMMGACNPDSLPGYTVEETRAAYRELVAAGLMDPLHTLRPRAGFAVSVDAGGGGAEGRMAQSRPFQPSFIARRICRADSLIGLSVWARVPEPPRVRRFGSRPLRGRTGR